MKIQLEGQLISHRQPLRCVACEQNFLADRLRMLLCHDSGSIAGDLCVTCIQQGTSHIQQQLKDRASELLKHPLTDDISPSPHQKALELWELATQPVVIPPFYHWWWKQLTMLAVETCSLEIAWREPISYRHRQPRSPKIIFLPEKPSHDRDN
jgi:hypothetical protein